MSVALVRVSVPLRSLRHSFGSLIGDYKREAFSPPGRRPNTTGSDRGGAGLTVLTGTAKLPQNQEMQ